MPEITSYNREELIQLFTDSLPHIDEQYKQIQEYISLDSSNKKTQKRHSSFLNNLFITIGVTLLTAFCLLGLINLFIYDPVKSFKYFSYCFIYVFIPIIILIIVIHILTYLSTKKELKKLQLQLEQCRKNIRQLKAEHQELSIIPFKYQTPISIREILDYLNNYRASNWTEAVNILEDTIYKNNMLYLQTKQTSLLNQQLEQMTTISINSILIIPGL